MKGDVFLRTCGFDVFIHCGEETAQHFVESFGKETEFYMGPFVLSRPVYPVHSCSTLGNTEYAPWAQRKRTL